MAENTVNMKIDLDSGNLNAVINALQVGIGQVTEELKILENTGEIAWEKYIKGIRLTTENLKTLNDMKDTVWENVLDDLETQEYKALSVEAFSDLVSQNITKTITNPFNTAYASFHDPAKKLTEDMQNSHAFTEDKFQAAQLEWIEDHQGFKPPLAFESIFPDEHSSVFHQKMTELNQVKDMFDAFEAGDSFRLAAEELYDVAAAAERANYIMGKNILTADNFATITKSGLDALKTPLQDAMKDGLDSDIWPVLGEVLEAFAVEKSAHLMMEAAYETVLGTATALSPFRVGEASAHFAAAAQYAAGAALMGTFVWAGKAHDGIDYIPKEGTWLLDKGERVVDARTNKDLKSFLTEKTGNSTVINVSIHGGDKEGVMEALPELEKTLIAAVTGNIIQGGSVKRAIMDYTR